MRVMRTAVILGLAWSAAWVSEAASPDAATPRRRVDVVFGTGLRAGGPRSDLEAAMHAQALNGVLSGCFLGCATVRFPTQSGGGLDSSLAAGLALRGRFGIRLDAARFDLGSTDGASFDD